MLLVCARDRHIVLPDLEITEPQAASHERQLDLLGVPSSGGQLTSCS